MTLTTGYNPPDPIAAMMDAALTDLPDPRVARRAQKYRQIGVVLLIIAAVCIAAVGLPFVRSIGSPWSGMALFVASSVLLVVGGVLIDKAFVIEDRALVGLDVLASAVQGSLDSAPNEPPAEKVRRRHYFGIGMLILSVFCVGTASTLLSARDPWNALMWCGFALTLFCIGIWQIELAARHGARSRRRWDAIQQRKAALRRNHLHRIQ